MIRNIKKLSFIGFTLSYILGLFPTTAMEEKNDQIVVRRENITPSLHPLPVDMRIQVLIPSVIHCCLDSGNISTLKSVCRDWYFMINGNEIQELINKYFNVVITCEDIINDTDGKIAGSLQRNKSVVSLTIHDVNTEELWNGPYNILEIQKYYRNIIVNGLQNKPYLTSLIVVGNFSLSTYLDCGTGKLSDASAVDILDMPHLRYLKNLKLLRCDEFDQDHTRRYLFKTKILPELITLKIYSTSSTRKDGRLFSGT